MLNLTRNGEGSLSTVALARFAYAPSSSGGGLKWQHTTTTPHWYGTRYHTLVSPQHLRHGDLEECHFRDYVPLRACSIKVDLDSGENRLGFVIFQVCVDILRLTRDSRRGQNSFV